MVKWGTSNPLDAEGLSQFQLTRCYYRFLIDIGSLKSTKSDAKAPRPPESPWIDSSCQILRIRRASKLAVSIPIKTVVLLVAQMSNLNVCSDDYEYQS